MTHIRAMRRVGRALGATLVGLLGAAPISAKPGGNSPQSSDPPGASPRSDDWIAVGASPGLGCTDPANNCGERNVSSSVTTQGGSTLGQAGLH